MPGPDLQSIVLVARDAVSHARIADLLDVVLIAGLSYALLRWLRASRARFIMTGVLLAGGLYFVGDLLGMHMSVALFEAALPAVLIGLLVIFQEDLRRGAERLAMFGKGVRHAGHATVDTVVEACAAMARHRVGALIVLRGREPLDRHLSGGVALSGKLSAPLLYSLFDPHSPGHDGAVVVERDRVRSFAVHLPLSAAQSEEAPGERGTRHAAARGLSERSDALVIVVSEERGEISVAHGGQLHAVDGAAALAAELHRFLSAGALDGVVPRQKATWGLRAAAAGIALFAWFAMSVQQGELVARTFEVPVSYRNLPADWLVTPPDPASVSVTISAPAPTLRALDPASLSVGVDLSGMDEGTHQVQLGAYSMELGPGMAMQQMQPDRVRFTARATSRHELGVHARLRGRSSSGKRLRVASVTPATLEVLVAKDRRARLTHLNTETIDRAELGDTLEREVGVVLPEGARLAPDQPDRVTVKLAPDPDRHRSGPRG